MASSPAMEKLQNMVATSAIHDGERDEKDDYTGVCHPGTREEHLEILRTWADNTPPETFVEWVYAIAGTGKTAMLRSFCTELEEQTGLPSISFFAWKGDTRRNTLKHFPATVMYQLSRRIPALVPHIEKAINEDPLLLQSAFKKQMDKLAIRPLLDCCDAVQTECHLIIVVDGLDELDAKGQTEFLDFIPYLLSRLSSLPISLLVSSRPEDMIVGAFQHPKLASITRSTRLGASDEDIWKFLNDKFDDINLRFPYLHIEHGGKWPSQEKREIMVRQSSGLFIWPTVAIRHIDKVEKGLGHNKRLEQVLSSADPKPWVASPLDNLYRTILEAHAPEDPNSVEYLRFTRRLALLCILDLGKFVRGLFGGSFAVLDWSDVLICALFDETVDELWDSVTGLFSLFSPRMPLSPGESPTPSISHRSLRDFTFNRARCGDKLYYSSERELHAEVACKLLKFLNTRQTYQGGAEMSAQFIDCAGEFLESHLKEAAGMEELGCCMDDIVLDYIPHTWPLATQVFLIVKLFDGLYRLADNPDFPEGKRRREALLSKTSAFFNRRARNAEGWDTSLFRLALFAADFKHDDSNAIDSVHSAHCWHVARATQCTCIDAYMRHISLGTYQKTFENSALFQGARTRLAVANGQDAAQDYFEVLRFFLSLSETSQRAIELSSFMPVIDYWTDFLLKHCPPDNDLYNTLGSICTAPLPGLPKRGDESWAVVRQFMWQTRAFDRYTKRCHEAGIETNFPPVEIPDSWWEGSDHETRKVLFEFGEGPRIKIPNDWWADRRTRGELLGHGCKPEMEIPDDWWGSSGWNPSWTWAKLLGLGFKPPFDIPRDWWRSEELREALPKLGYDAPVASTRASQSSLVSSRFEDVEERVVETDEEAVDQDAAPSEQHVESEVEDMLSNGADQEESSTGVGPLQSPLVVVPETNGLASDAGTRSSNLQRHGAGVRAFFKRLVRRR